MPLYDYECTRGCRVHMLDVARRIADRDVGAPLCPDCLIQMSRFLSVSCDKRAASDDIPGGVVLENYGPQPVKVYSHTERKRLMKFDTRGRRRVDHLGREYQLTEAVRHVGVPGSDKSPHTTSWSTIDAETMRKAEALVSHVENLGMNESDRETAPHDPTMTPNSVRSVHGGVVGKSMLRRIKRAARE